MRARRGRGRAQPERERRPADRARSAERERLVEAPESQHAARHTNTAPRLPETTHRGRRCQDERQPEKPCSQVRRELEREGGERAHRVLGPDRHELEKRRRRVLVADVDRGDPAVVVEVLGVQDVLARVERHRTACRRHRLPTEEQECRAREDDGEQPDSPRAGERPRPGAGCHCGTLWRHRIGTDT
jgi:hypothetical protein